MTHYQDGGENRAIRRRSMNVAKHVNVIFWIPLQLSFKSYFISAEGFSVLVWMWEAGEYVNSVYLLLFRIFIEK